MFRDLTLDHCHPLSVQVKTIDSGITCTFLPVQCLEKMLLSHFEINLRRVPVVIILCEAAEVLLGRLPLPGDHHILKMVHVEVRSRFLLQP